MNANIDEDLTKLLITAFSRLNKQGAYKSFPSQLALSRALEKVLPPKGDAIVPVVPETATLFSTAAVDMWLRSVHSFLISAAVTDLSPIWSSVSGYYASHYCVRAFAHLLGHFQLFRKRRVVQLEMKGGKHLCSFTAKTGRGGEHGFYWRIVKQHPQFVKDSLFTDNREDDDVSDAAHRNRGNYGDHFQLFPKFYTPKEEFLKSRIEFISQICFSVPPIPRRDKFPDIESVQVVAYHRIVRFRQFLDEILGGSNRFWNVHRKPGWVGGLMDFQLTEQPVKPGSLLN